MAALMVGQPVDLCNRAWPSRRGDATPLTGLIEDRIVARISGAPQFTFVGARLGLAPARLSRQPRQARVSNIYAELRGPASPRAPARP